MSHQLLHTLRIAKADENSTTYTTLVSTHSHTLPSPPPRTTANAPTLTLAPRIPQYPTYTPVPSFLGPCSSSPEKLSSACSCLIAPIRYVEHTVDVTVAVFGGTVSIMFSFLWLEECSQSPRKFKSPHFHCSDEPGTFNDRGES